MMNHWHKGLLICVLVALGVAILISVIAKQEDRSSVNKPDTPVLRAEAVPATGNLTNRTKTLQKASDPADGLQEADERMSAIRKCVDALKSGNEMDVLDALRTLSKLKARDPSLSPVLAKLYVTTKSIIAQRDALQLIALQADEVAKSFLLERLSEGKLPQTKKPSAGAMVALTEAVLVLASNGGLAPGDPLSDRVFELLDDPGTVLAERLARPLLATGNPQFISQLEQRFFNTQSGSHRSIALSQLGGALIAYEASFLERFAGNFAALEPAQQSRLLDALWCAAGPLSSDVQKAVLDKKKDQSVRLISQALSAPDASVRFSGCRAIGALPALRTQEIRLDLAKLAASDPDSLVRRIASHVINQDQGR
jgi:hypothetical protein